MTLEEGWLLSKHASSQKKTPPARALSNSRQPRRAGCACCDAHRHIGIRVLELPRFAGETIIGARFSGQSGRKGFVSWIE